MIQEYSVFLHDAEIGTAHLDPDGRLIIELGGNDVANDLVEQLNYGSIDHIKLFPAAIAESDL